MQTNAETQAMGFGLAAVALWSTVATGFKLGLRSLDPAQLLWLGSMISLIFFAIVWLAVRPARSSRSGYVRAACLGLINPFVYYLVLFEAYDRLPAQIAQPLNYTWAITLAILAIPVLKQRLSGRALIGIGVSYAGVIVLITRGDVDGFDTFDPVGIGLALASTLLWASYWLATVRTNTHPVSLMLIGFGVGTPLIGLYCFATVGFPPISMTNLGYGLWVGLIEMGITFLLWQRALATTRHAARIGQLIFLSPFASLVLIAYVLDEPVHPSSIVGLACIVAGLVLVNRDRRTKPAI